MPDGPSPEIPIREGGERSRQPKILPKDERNTIAESLRERGITFGIYPVEGGRDTTRLEPLRDQIESVAYPTIAEVAREMPIGDVSIGVFDAPEKVIREYGIYGYAHGTDVEGQSSLLEIDLDPESPHRETAIGKDLRRMLRHELHHDKRLDSLGAENLETLLDAFIFEGLATHYEIEGSDDEPSLYATALTADQIPILLERARKDFASEDSNTHQAWLFGEVQDIPRWAGYALGHYLVGEYIKNHPEQKASTLYATPSEEFIKPLSDTVNAAED